MPCNFLHDRRETNRKVGQVKVQIFGAQAMTRFWTNERQQLLAQWVVASFAELQETFPQYTIPDAPDANPDCILGRARPHTGQTLNLHVHIRDVPVMQGGAATVMADIICESLEQMVKTQWVGRDSRRRDLTIYLVVHVHFAPPPKGVVHFGRAEHTSQTYIAQV